MQDNRTPKERIRQAMVSGNFKVKPEANAMFPLEPDSRKKVDSGDFQFDYINLDVGFEHDPIEIEGLWYNYSTGFVLSWGVKGFGFGELTFSLRAKKTPAKDALSEPTFENVVLECDNEGMSRKFVKQALAALGDKVKLTHE
jgi:hypothetical protein